MIVWDKGVPYLEFGTVTKVTKTTYYVDGSAKPECGWHATAKEAFVSGFEYLFGYHDTIFGAARNKPRDNWNAIDTAKVVCRLMRLKRRFDAHC